MSGVIASVITPHTPRMGVEASAPDFVRPLIAGSRELGEWIRSLAPDVVVVQTTHWVSTFNWYATALPVHEGLCVADEAPDLIPGLPYRYDGHPDFANKLVAVGNAAGIPFFTNTCEHYRWDYGTFVPLQYLDPEATLPVVTIPTVILSDLDESIRVGRAVDAAAQEAGLRVVFISSTALTHALVRGPERWPAEECQALDERFLALLESGDLETLLEWFPVYAKESVAEMGGRVVAGFLGALAAMAREPYGMRRFGAYAQSSGSGNQSIACSPALV